MRLSEIQEGMLLLGVHHSGPVEVIIFRQQGETSGTLTYKFHNQLDERLVSADEAANFEIHSEQRWSFDADGNLFRLAAEARRIKTAHLS